MGLCLAVQQVFAQDQENSLEICNKGSLAVDIAITQRNGWAEWGQKGWYRLEVGGCEKMPLAATDNYFTFLMTNQRGESGYLDIKVDGQTSDKAYCVDRKRALDVGGLNESKLKSCKSGQELAPFPVTYRGTGGKDIAYLSRLDIYPGDNSVLLSSIDIPSWQARQAQIIKEENEQKIRRFKNIIETGKAYIEEKNRIRAKRLATNSILQCGEYYLYYDTSFMKKTQECVTNRYAVPFGYTVTKVPPEKNVTFVEDLQTWCIGIGPRFYKQHSKGGRYILREALDPVHIVHMEEYHKKIKINGNWVSCKDYTWDTNTTMVKQISTPQSDRLEKYDISGLWKGWYGSKRSRNPVNLQIDREGDKYSAILEFIFVDGQSYERGKLLYTSDTSVLNFVPQQWFHKPVGYDRLNPEPFVLQLGNNEPIRTENFLPGFDLMVSYDGDTLIGYLKTSRSHPYSQSIQLLRDSVADRPLFTSFENLIVPDKVEKTTIQTAPAYQIVDRDISKLKRSYTPSLRYPLKALGHEINEVKVRVSVTFNEDGIVQSVIVGTESLNWFDRAANEQAMGMRFEPETDDSKSVWVRTEFDIVFDHAVKIKYLNTAKLKKEKLSRIAPINRKLKKVAKLNNEIDTKLFRSIKKQKDSIIRCTYSINNMKIGEHIYWYKKIPVGSEIIDQLPDDPFFDGLRVKPVERCPKTWSETT